MESGPSHSGMEVRQSTTKGSVGSNRGLLAHIVDRYVFFVWSNVGNEDPSLALGCQGVEAWI